MYISAVAMKYSFPASVINLKIFNESNVEIHNTAEKVIEPLLRSLKKVSRIKIICAARAMGR